MRDTAHVIPTAHETIEWDALADALRAITDAKAARADNRVMKRVYSSLRGQAKVHTAAAMPRVAGLIERHVGG